MSRIRFRAAISLDGFVAGPDQSLEHPLGKGGPRLHAWAFPLRSFHKMQGKDGGEVNASDAVVEEASAGLGATIMGRNMFGPIRGPWPAGEQWNGWWGDDPPYHHPVFVLTQHARDPVKMQGGTTFNFVTGGVDAALAQARAAAGDKDIAIGGGASVVRQFLRRGLVDEMLLHQAPILLGKGERLFVEGEDGLGDDLRGLQLSRVVPAPGVTHLFFRR
jgi:dihydrofolate reductase